MAAVCMASCRCRMAVGVSSEANAFHQAMHSARVCYTGLRRLSHTSIDRHSETILSTQPTHCLRQRLPFLQNQPAVVQARDCATRHGQVCLKQL